MRYRSLVLVFILCLSGVSGAAERVPLRLATLEYPPYITETERGPQGLVVDVVKAAFARIGQPIPLDERWKVRQNGIHLGAARYACVGHDPSRKMREIQNRLGYAPPPGLSICEALRGRFPSRRRWPFTIAFPVFARVHRRGG